MFIENLLRFLIGFSKWVKKERKLRNKLLMRFVDYWPCALSLTVRSLARFEYQINKSPAFSGL